MKKNRIIWTIICVIFGFLLAFHVFYSGGLSKGERVPTAIGRLEDVRRIFKKLKLNDVITKEINGKGEIIISEVKLEEDISWDDSWGNMSMFKKIQKIHFYGTGIYVINMSEIDNKGIIVKNFKKTLEVTVPKPSVKAVVINEEKTEYEAVEKGWLRFGEVKLIPAEYQILENQVKLKMQEKMKSEEVYKKALSSSQKSLENIISDMVKSYVSDDYNIIVNFK